DVEARFEWKYEPFAILACFMNMIHAGFPRAVIREVDKRVNVRRCNRLAFKKHRECRASMLHMHLPD
ncbi:MAG: hypothetical protein MI754_03405, partial [Chromatiales bacterium]|nr:hypothetical protein [Chromatiales bacterium]